MRMSRLFESTRLLYYALALLLMGHALQASGYDKTIEAVYKPDPNNPSQKTFVIVTPGKVIAEGGLRLAQEPWA